MNFSARILVFVLLPAVVFINRAKAERILALEWIASKSHKLTYINLLEELGLRGHNVTLLTPIVATKQMKNVNEVLTVDWEVVHREMLKKLDMNLYRMKERNENLNPFLMLDFFSQFCETTYDQPHVKALLNEKFDLIFVQPFFNDCVMGFVYQFKIPVVLFSPVGVPGFLAETIGNHIPHAVQPNVFLDLPAEMNFYQRFMNFGFNVLIEAILRFSWEPAMEAIYRKKLGDDSIPSVREILSNASLMLSNGHFTMNSPKPFFPDVIDVGGIHSRPPKPLPKDFDDFIKKGKHGFIYFSMGTGIAGSEMPEEKRLLFRNVFAKLKQQVIWKWEIESMPDLPANVKLTKWAPQQDLLGHKDIQLFITHCGGGGTEESFYHGVPLVGIPFFGDQPLNAKLAKKHDFIVEMDWNSLTEENLLAAINEVLNNPKYRNNVKRISALYKDQPDDPMKRAVYWVEYVIRHKGAFHLRNAGRKLNYFQYHSFDVMLAYVTIIVATLYLIFALLRLICRKLCCRSASNKDNNKKKSGKKSKRE